jgi:sortase A
VTDEQTMDVAVEPYRELSQATSDGLPTQFVGQGTHTAQPDPADPAEAAPAAAPILDEPTAGPVRGFEGTRLLRAGMVASTVGLVAFLFVGYVTSFANLQQHRQQHALLNQYTAADKAKILSGRAISEGSPAGILSIPALRLTQVVVQGTNATDLLKGPGLMTGTARPGSLGNSVIAGHRSMAGSPFGNLTRLHTGDRIEVVTALGAYHYQVLAVGSARPGVQDPISPNRHPRLTLVTSGGTSASDGRTYVVAKLVTAPNRLAVPRHPPTLAQRGLTGDPAAVLPSILWGLAMAAGLAAMFWAYWRFSGRHWSVYLLSTPILLAIGFLWYENLIRLLPGTT